jgi:hypothetical protein
MRGLAPADGAGPGWTNLSDIMLVRYAADVAGSGVRRRWAVATSIDPS